MKRHRLLLRTHFDSPFEYPIDDARHVLLGDFLLRLRSCFGNFLEIVVAVVSDPKPALTKQPRRNCSDAVEEPEHRVIILMILKKLLRLTPETSRETGERRRRFSKFSATRKRHRIDWLSDIKILVLCC